MSSLDTPWPLLKRDEVDNSPSRLNSSTPISTEGERKYRSSAILFISHCGLLLQLPNVTVSTACVYFHRFYSVIPFQQQEWNVIAQACLLLASKVEENSRRVRDIINIAYRVSHMNELPLTVSALYWEMKDSLIHAEQLLLRVLNFSLNVTHPHHYLLHICRELSVTPTLASIAFALCNDSRHIPLMLQYSSSSIACGCIYLAGEMVGENVGLKDIRSTSIGTSSNNSRSEGEGEWWEVFDANRMEMEDISHQIIDFYERE